MQSGHEFLTALTMVLCVAAVTTVLFQRLRQPVVLGYLIAGLLIGPYVTAVPLVADTGVVNTLSELGVILLMFSLGLEFSFGKLAKVGFTAGLTAIIQCSFMVWLGFVVGRLFGWTPRESLFTGAIIAISSTTIIAKAFDEQGIKGSLRELVVGVLIVEDLIAILLMTMLTAVSSGADLGPADFARTIGELLAFLIGLITVGIFVVPRAIKAIVRLGRPETTLIASVGLCFGVALLAQYFKYSVALGAFIAGSLVAESGEEEKVEHLVRPVRDIFAAIFFVSVGMLIDPALVAKHWVAITVLIVAVVLGKIVSVALGAFLTGQGTRTSMRAGMSLAQIGEFSFIIAGLGISLKATGEFLYPVAIAVSAFTTLTTPWLIKASGPMANFVDRKLPRPLQTFASLYGSWVEQIKSAPRKDTAGARVRRLARLIVFDGVLVAVVVIGASVTNDRITQQLQQWTGVTERTATMLVIAGAATLTIPFWYGIIQLSRRLGALWAESALPAKPNGKMDLAAAPRRVLVATLQVTIVLLVGAPVVAVTQPFLPGFPGALVLLVLLVVLGIAFWRSAFNLQGHVRAGAELIVEALAAQSLAKPHTGEAAPANPDLTQVQQMLAGLGTPMPVRLEEKSVAAGKTLAQLNLRGLTGATVLAITRGSQGVLVPSANEVLQPGDVLALAGTQTAVETARLLLSKEPAGPFDEGPVEA